MATKSSYDLVVIGAGPGGYVAAVRAAQLGLATALVERDAALGGTCLLRGCIPTKFLLQAAQHLDESRHFARYGLNLPGEIEVDWKTTITEKAKTVRRLTGAISALMKKGKIDVHTGHGALTGKGTIEVAAGGGETTALRAKNILLATGSRPKMLPFLERDGKRVITSDEALELPSIPGSLIVIGSGAVGTEFASLYNSFGSKVTLVEALPTMVPTEDEEIGKAMAKAFGKRKIDVRVDTTVAGAQVSEGGVRAVVESGGKRETLEAEILLVAVGREPVTDGLGLDATAIRLERGFIPVDAYMRTAEDGVYAIGDVVPTAGLAHLASKEGILAVEHMAGRDVRPIRYETCPNAIYSDPEVASVGYTEAQAVERGYEVKVGRFPFTHNSKAMIGGHQEGMVKIVSDAAYDEVLGVHVMGYKATELIAEGVLGMTLETTVEEMFRAIHPHPTLSESVMEAAENLHGESIHI
jgi:dihydrolipoamide dehydrogenase